jgi:prepilin-type processing-associated H-X9-DG protein
VRSKTSIGKSEIAILAVSVVLLVAVTGAAGSGGRRRAKETVCLSRLQSWGRVFDAFARDNDNHFISGEGAGSGMWWIQPLKPYWGDSRLLLCPEATGSLSPLEVPNMTSVAWRVTWQGASYTGSYGLNGWVCNPHQASGVWGRSPASGYWRSPGDPGARTVPVFADMWWTDAWPRETDVPPVMKGMMPETPSTHEMQRVCVDRHNGAVNCLFMDWSSRKVGLKELWTLNWHRNCNTNGRWTKAGGAAPDDWPQWMRSFKDF